MRIVLAWYLLVHKTIGRFQGVGLEQRSSAQPESHSFLPYALISHEPWHDWGTAFAVLTFYSLLGAAVAHCTHTCLGYALLGCQAEREGREPPWCSALPLALEILVASLVAFFESHHMAPNEAPLSAIAWSGGFFALLMYLGLWPLIVLAWVES